MAAALDEIVVSFHSHCHAKKTCSKDVCVCVWGCKIKSQCLLHPRVHLPQCIAKLFLFSYQGYLVLHILHV